jgi:hypothetical protein
VSHVINFDLPDRIDDYVHRIGGCLHCLPCRVARSDCCRGQAGRAGPARRGRRSRSASRATSSFRRCGKAVVAGRQQSRCHSHVPVGFNSGPTFAAVACGASA